MRRFQPLKLQGLKARYTRTLFSDLKAGPREHHIQGHQIQKHQLQAHSCENSKNLDMIRCPVLFFSRASLC